MKSKRLVSGLVSVLLFITVIFSSCANDYQTALGKQFTLPVGKTETITGEALKIEFLEVTNDSRCPTGAQCVMAGEAKCLMLINYNNSQSSLTFTQEGSNEENVMDFNIYRIVFRLEPYPKLGKEIAPEDYKLIMTVTKFTKQ
jgi:hypothetical protein